MKINLITYSRTRNYGGILQAYGLYRYLELNNYDVSFIDYIPVRCNINNKKVFVDDAASKSRIWGMNPVTKWLYGVIRYNAIKKTFTPFLSFMDKRVKFTKPYYSVNEIYDDIPKADVYITGSDQVWNSQFTKGQKLDLPFYLPFVKNSKKISYASSFGKDTIPHDHKITVQNLISDYDFVSVREDSGKKLLQDMEIDSTVVVDPTILCPVSEWNKIAGEKLDNNYILLYQVKFNKSIYDTAKAVADLADKKLIVISLDIKDKKNVKENLKVAPPIEDWLSYIKYADGVITDSFHASVFSILFNTQFIVNSGTRKGMSTRISNLLNLAGLNERCVDSFDSNTVLNSLNKEIDWNKSHIKLDSLRSDSVQWLENAVNN